MTNVFSIFDGKPIAQSEQSAQNALAVVFATMPSWITASPALNMRIMELQKCCWRVVLVDREEGEVYFRHDRIRVKPSRPVTLREAQLLQRFVDGSYLDWLDRLEVKGLMG